MQKPATVCIGMHQVNGINVDIVSKTAFLFFEKACRRGKKLGNTVRDPKYVSRCEIRQYW